MIAGITTSESALDANQTWLDVTGNNLANINTTGYKTDQASFEDLLYNQIAPQAATANGDTSSGAQIGTGVAVDGTTGLFTQGDIEQTGQPLDVAINGQGFFQVSLPGGGTGYTRDGALQLNASGQLVTSQGNLVDPSLNIPADATSLSIGTDGTVSAVLPGSSTPQTLGQLTLVNFVNPDGLTRIGSNLFTQSTDSGSPQIGTPGQGGLGTLQQGFLEQSNVDPTTELTNLLIAGQNFDFNSQAITVQDTMLQDTLTLVS